MIYITNGKDELVKIINIVMKLPASRNRFQDSITNKYHENRENYDAAITYAFYHYYEITAIIQGDDLVHSGIGQILQIYNSMLNLYEDDWFLHILKLLLLRKSVSYLISKEELLMEIETLVKLQADADKKMEYFIIPFLVLSEFHLREGNLEQVEQDLEQGLESSIQKPIAYTGLCVHFKMVLQEIQYLAKEAGSDKYKNLLKQINRIYFGK